MSSANWLHLSSSDVLIKNTKAITATTAIRTSIVLIVTPLGLDAPCFAPLAAASSIRSAARQNRSCISLHRLSDLVYLTVGDDRTAKTIEKRLKELGREPVWKDWDASFDKIAQAI